MKIENAHRVLESIPHMRLDKAKEISQIIIDKQYQNILELGFAHGVSTCYMACAIDELGSGNIVTIDRPHTRNADPNIESLLNTLGLRAYVTIHYEQTSYIWRLMQMLEEVPLPKFDLCYIDGAHTWETDGFAFYLVDKLLNPGGLIIFDDLHWSFDISPSLKDTEAVKKMPIDYRTTPQIRKVYELLVKTHISYVNFVEKDDWAYAYKSSEQLDK